MAVISGIMGQKVVNIFTQLEIAIDVNIDLFVFIDFFRGQIYNSG